jgi:transaldolase/glucose-6-phosphate isomerase
MDGRDKLTLLADESVAPLGAWLEQLVAESSGKQGKGIVVVDSEPITNPAGYGADRLFVYLRREGRLDAAVDELRQAGHPTLVFDISDAYDLGAEFYRWEIATAFACAILGVNSFDQPDVQDNKTRTVNKINAYSQYNKLEKNKPILKINNLQAYSNLHLPGTDLKNNLHAFLNMIGKGDPSKSSGRNYVAINAYLPRNAEMEAALQELRLAIREKTGCATTVGFGPRFLHSTGQLHKGGPDSGLFLQITSDPTEDLEIPGQKMTFGVLERAQSLGDYEALAARNRRILRLHLSSPEVIKELAKAVK